MEAVNRKSVCSLVTIVGLLWMAALVGCDEAKKYKTAPISGRVTLDGQPLAGATVKFMPMRQNESSTITGPDALGTTDGDGKYTLTSIFDDKGATVGQNQVMISTLKAEPDPNNVDKMKIIVKEKVPDKYSLKPLTFEVPDKGSDSANFDLSSKK